MASSSCLLVLNGLVFMFTCLSMPGVSAPVHDVARVRVKTRPCEVNRRCIGKWKLPRVPTFDGKYHMYNSNDRILSFFRRIFDMFNCLWFKHTLH
jgi:hypothetical protein